jgi:hypothetical protein
MFAGCIPASVSSGFKSDHSALQAVDVCISIGLHPSLTAKSATLQAKRSTNNPIFG